MSTNKWIIEYASGESSATAGKTFPVEPSGERTIATWFQCIGAGTVVVACEGGQVFTKHAAGGEVYKGSFTALTSTTCTYLVMGNGAAPPAIAATGATVTPGSGGPYLTISVANQATLSGLAQTVDGVALSSAGMRVYLAKQTTASQNGGWVVQSGTWTRPSDWASGATIPLGTLITIAPGGTANHIAFGSTWYVDSASDVVDTGTIVAYPRVCKGIVTLTSASPSTGAVSSLWIKHATQTSLSLTNETTAANGVKGTIVAGAGTGSLAITGPNTVTDAISYTATNG